MSSHSQVYMYEFTIVDLAVTETMDARTLETGYIVSAYKVRINCYKFNIAQSSQAIKNRPF